MRRAACIEPAVVFLSLAVMTAIGRAAVPPLDVPLDAPKASANLAATHIIFRQAANDDPRLAYSVAIPKAWMRKLATGRATKAFEMQTLATFAASSSPHAPSVTVRLTQVPYEISLEMWAKRALVAEGWTVVARKWIAGKFGEYFDVTGTRNSPNGNEVRRTSVRVDGEHVFAIDCITPREAWDEIKESFVVVHRTFELLDKDRKEQMEPWQKAAATGPNFELACPESWRVDPVPSSSPDVSAVDIRLVSPNETLLAYLQAKAERNRAAVGRRPELLELEAQAMARLRKLGLTPLGPSRAVRPDEDPWVATAEGWLGGFSGRARLGAAQVLVRLTFIYRGGVILTIAMLSPRFEDDELSALRAHRAYEIAGHTIRLAGMDATDLR
jgi:hypothetical protein